jgi:hypothetical protein
MSSDTEETPFAMKALKGFVDAPYRDKNKTDRSIYNQIEDA